MSSPLLSTLWNRLAKGMTSAQHHAFERQAAARAGLAAGSCANSRTKAALNSMMRRASFTMTTAEGIFWMSALAFLMRELAHVGHAHGALGLLAEQRHAEFAAGIVAAAAAVQFIVAPTSLPTCAGPRGFASRATVTRRRRRHDEIRGRWPASGGRGRAAPGGAHRAEHALALGHRGAAGNAPCGPLTQPPSQASNSRNKPSSGGDALDAVERLLDGAQARERHERAIVDGAGRFHAGDHAAVHRIPRALRGALGDEMVPGRGREFLGVDFLLLQPAAQILEGQGHIQQFRDAARPRVSWRCTGR